MGQADGVQGTQRHRPGGTHGPACVLRSITALAADGRRLGGQLGHGSPRRNSVSLEDVDSSSPDDPRMLRGSLEPPHLPQRPLMARHPQ